MGPLVTLTSVRSFPVLSSRAFLTTTPAGDVFKDTLLVAKGVTAALLTSTLGGADVHVVVDVPEPLHKWLRPNVSRWRRRERE